MTTSNDRSLEEKVREFILESPKPVLLAQVIQAFEGEHSHADIRRAFLEVAKTGDMEIGRDANAEI